jgi:hypothetical protein
MLPEDGLGDIPSIFKEIAVPGNFDRLVTSVPLTNLTRTG